jgi:hypothetical protein
MTSAAIVLARSAIAIDDLDYYVIRSSMVIVVLFFCYTKRFTHDAEALFPIITINPIQLLAILYI